MTTQWQIISPEGIVYSVADEDVVMQATVVDIPDCDDGTIIRREVIGRQIIAALPAQD